MKARKLQEVIANEKKTEKGKEKELGTGRDEGGKNMRPREGTGRGDGRKKDQGLGTRKC